MKNLIVYKNTGSTSDEIKKYSLNSLVVAETQDRGRGRTGNSWLSPAGGLYFSYNFKLCEFNNNINNIILLISLGLGSCCHEILSELSQEKILLKWPNDLVNTEGKKLGGILTERNNYIFTVGIGINLFELNNNISFLKIKKIRNLSKNYLALKIANKICENFEKFKNFEFFLEHLLELKNYWFENSYFKLGDIISAIKLFDNSCVTGILVDIDNNGNIILQENSQDKLIIINSSEFKTIRKL